MIHSDAARQEALEEHQSIKLSTYGIFFMGTPHQGSSSGVHLGVLVRNVVSIFGTANDKITKYLERDSEWIQQQLSQYGPLSKDFVTKFAYETYPTQIAMGKTIMVSNLSLLGLSYEILIIFRLCRMLRQSFQELQMQSPWQYRPITSI